MRDETRRAVLVGADVASLAELVPAYFKQAYDWTIVSGAMELVKNIARFHGYQLLEARVGAQPVRIEIACVPEEDESTAMDAVRTADIIAVCGDSLADAARVIASARNNVDSLGQILIFGEAWDAKERLMELLRLELGDHDVDVDSLQINCAVPDRLSALRMASQEEQICIVVEPSIERLENKTGSDAASYLARRREMLLGTALAMLGYLGWNAEVESLAQALRNPKIQTSLQGALKEVGKALCAEEAVPLDEVDALAGELLQRLANPLLALTVSAELQRACACAQQQNSKLRKVLDLCRKHGVKPVYLSMGMAGELLYQDSLEERGRGIRALFRKRSTSRAIKKLYGMDNRELAYWWIHEFSRNLERGLLRNSTGE